MDFDLLIYIIFQIPLAFIIFKQDQLHKPKVLLKFFVFATLLLLLGHSFYITKILLYKNWVTLALKPP